MQVLSLYSLDVAAGELVLVETPPGVDLRTAPFMYVAQRRQACRMIAAPFPAVLALVEQLKEEGRAMPTTPSLDDARVSVMGVL